jgi:hypothetical protein
MEPSMSHFIAELDPSVFVLDCLPNMNEPTNIVDRVCPFVRTLRAARPTTPIVMVENVIVQNSHVVNPKRTSQQKNAEYKIEFEKLLAEGVKDLHYIPSDKLLGDDFEGTVDSVHPTDVGFMRLAEAHEPVLRKLV